MSLTGILVVDKPAGWTSFDVIAKLRGVLGTRKLGHSGTLDPMATGVLPVFAGAASKAVDLQPDQNKTYLATLRLGLATDTGDITGSVLKTAPVTAGGAELRAVLPGFVGQRMQTPPMYSAVKIGGQPLYKLARAGKTVERAARPIVIYKLEYLGQLSESDHQLRIECGKGTYVRALAEELGAALGLPAALAALRRTRAGLFAEEQAHTLEEILAAKEAGGEEALARLLLGVDTVFAALPALTVSEQAGARLLNGAPVYRCAAPDGQYRLYTGAGGFLGLGRAEGRVLTAQKLLIERK